MTTVEFMQQIEKRFPAIQKEMGMDISKLIEPLKDNQRMTLWDKFLDTYEYGTPPRRAVFVKIMAVLGILRSGSGNEIYYYFCEKCGIGYPINICKCNVCNGELKLYEGKTLPRSYMKMQQSCSSCSRFIPFESTGAMCKYWGMKQEDWGLYGQPYRDQLENCKRCECHICCRGQRIYNTDYKLYRDMIKTGELKGGWEQK